MNAQAELMTDIELHRQRAGIQSFLRFRRWLKSYEPPKNKKAAPDATRTPPTTETRQLFAQMRSACEQNNSTRKGQMMNATKEELYDCPRCGRGHFTLRGLRGHVCAENGNRYLSEAEVRALVVARSIPSPKTKEAP